MPLGKRTELERMTEQEIQTAWDERRENIQSYWCGKCGRHYHRGETYWRGGA